MNLNNDIYLNAHAKVIINDTVVHEFGHDENIVSVETHNDSNHIGAYCDIVMPQNIRLEYLNNKNDAPTYADQNPAVDLTHANDGYITAQSRYFFNTGDHIIVKAKYDGYEKSPGSDSDGYLTIFDGFLYDFYESTPLKIKCLDYIYWFNIGIYGDKIVTAVKNKKARKPKILSGKGASYAKIQFKDLMQDIVDTVNYNIEIWNEENDTNYPLVTLFPDIFDMTLIDIHFISMSPAAILEWFKKELGMAITLIGNQLYVNIASFTNGTVILQTDTNVIASSLQTTNLQHLKSKKKSKGSNSIFLRLKLKAYFIKENGTKDSFEIGDENGQLRECFFYKVAPGKMVPYAGKQVPENYKKLAEEALNKYHQDRYTGTVETLLYPFCNLFWKVRYFDIRYPERNANYVVTMIQYSLGENGFHKKLKLAFLSDQS